MSRQADHTTSDTFMNNHGPGTQNANFGNAHQANNNGTGSQTNHFHLYPEEHLTAQQEEIQRCHQLFRLSDKSRNVSYEWYKDRVEDRVEGTCQWFLQHADFKRWLKQDVGPLLITADPGCGKSVLAKYLIDGGILQPATICYFFFKDQDQNTVRQALCALLHQLLCQKPFLVRHALPQFRENGDGLINVTGCLWTILQNATKDAEAGPIIIVLDALDECTEHDLRDLVWNLKSQFASDKMGHNKLKYILTSRPYDTIVSKFRDSDLSTVFPNICIPGEEESEAIGKEINHVITHRVKQLSETKKLSPDIKSYLETRLQKTIHRTYLWVYLVFEYLENENLKKTQIGIESMIARLPDNISEAYEQILSKSKKKERPLVQKALRIILAASRPLTLSEMNIAMNIQTLSEQAKAQSIQDLDLEDNEDFKSRLRSLCGLFISIYNDKIYFLHQTAREFLLVAEPPVPISISSGTRWHHSITTRQAQAVLAELCVLYLNFFNSDDSLPTETNGEGHHSIDSHAFLDYSAKNWGDHFREASILEDATITSYAVRICNPDSKSYSAWFRIYWGATSNQAPDFTNLLVASYFGHSGIVKQLLGKGANVKAKDSNYGRAALGWAAWGGHEVVVKQLLDKGANVEVKDNNGTTVLGLAAKRGNEAVVKQLLDKGANIEVQDEDGTTALGQAARGGHGAVVNQLLDKGANVEAKDNNGTTALSYAAWNGHEAVVKQLLDKGTNVDIKDYYSTTALLYATKRGHKAVVKQLLDKGANVEAKDKHDTTALWYAAFGGHEAVVKQLLDKGANVEANGNCSTTALMLAAERGQMAVVKQLLDKGANVEAKDKYGRAALGWAARSGHEAVVKQLLDKGANINVQDKRGTTALWHAAWDGHEAVVKQLLDKGANVEAKDNSGTTALWWAAWGGHEAMVKQLLDKGANVEVKGNDGRIILGLATERGHKAVVNQLLDKGTNVEVKDKHDTTVLGIAAERGHEAVVKQLLDKGANIEANDNGGTTAMMLAAKRGHKAVVKQLLDKGANVEANDNSGTTALMLAAKRGHKAVVKQLLDKGANVEAKDKCGRAALGWAARAGHEAVVKQLLDKGANINAQDKWGTTALWHAAWDGHKAVVKQLLDKGANVEAKATYGMMALEYIVELRHEGVVKQLSIKCGNIEAKITTGWSDAAGVGRASRTKSEGGETSLWRRLIMYYFSGV